MAVATGSAERLHMEALVGVPEATPAASAQDHPSLRRRERSSLLKNRMREICTSGSVRGGDGNIPAYSAQHGLGPPARAHRYLRGTAALGDVEQSQGPLARAGVRGAQGQVTQVLRRLPPARIINTDHEP